MKKYLFMILTLVVVLTFIPNYKFRADEGIIENLIEMKSISYQERTYTINQKINVNVGQKYTLVFDKDIFGDDLTYLKSGLFGITIYYNMFYSDDIDIHDHELGHYAEFYPSRNIEKIFIKTGNYSVTNYPLFMLYEGSVESFPGFINYLNDGREVIKEEPLVYLTKLNDLASIEDIVSKIEIESDFENFEIKIYKDEYTLNNNQVGIYDVEIHIVDQSDNLIKRIEIKVKVLSYINPHIEGPEEVILYRHEFTSLYDVLDEYQYLVIDNGIHPQNIYIESDDWDSNYAGTYTARLSTLDLEGNEIEKFVNVVLIDNTPPKIIKNADIIYTFNDVSPLTKEDILKSFEISDDDLFTNLEILVDNYDNYIENSMFEGDYEVIIQVRDLSNNISVSNVIIRVIKQKTIIVKPDVRFFLTMEESNNMTIREIEDWFINQLAKFEITATNIEVLFTDYELSSKSGNYYMDLLYSVGSEQIRERIMINVEPTKYKKMSPYLITAIVLSSLLVTIIPVYYIYSKKIKYKKHNS